MRKIGWSISVLLIVLIPVALAVDFTESSIIEPQSLETSGQVKGSINFCKIVLDEEGNIVDGSENYGRFTIEDGSPDVEAEDRRYFGEIEFETPIELEENSLGEGIHAQCFLIDGLDLGSYYYSEERIEGTKWIEPKYNDQFDHDFDNLDDMFYYGTEFFDGIIENIYEYNINSDGNIVLYEGRPDRTLVIVNQYQLCYEQFCSQTQGGWGSECSGDNPGCKRDTIFETIEFLQVGYPNYINFTSSAALKAYLPAGGPANPLSGNHTDPLSTEAGVFGGQITALKLNVVSGIYGLEGHEDISDQVIVSGPFTGKTVEEFLEIAEAVFGGSSNEYTPSQVNEAASLINENYVDCEINNGFLSYECTEPICGDGEVNQDSEECDGLDGVGENEYCTDQCELIHEYTCVEAIQEGLLTASIDGGEVTIINNAHNDYDVGVASYKKYDEFIDNQTLYDNKEGTVLAQDDLVLLVELPLCAYQLDVYCGETLLSLDGQRYGERLITAEHAGGDYCTDVFCGDGIVNQENEQCDGEDGVGPNQECNEFCELIELNYCGDGIKQSPNDQGQFEECDGLDGVLEHQTCNEQCELEDIPYCGDGITNNDEECDLGDVIDSCIPDYADSCQYCTSECMYEEIPGPYCGDGEVQEAYEECEPGDDVGENKICNQFCEIEDLPYCGDGNLDQDEFCDDGNLDDGDGCNSLCQIEYCGDGIINNGEVCDDGINNGLACVPNYDDSCFYCSSECTPAQIPGPYCGDGEVQEAYEECEPGDELGEGYICNDQCIIDEIPPPPEPRKIVGLPYSLIESVEDYEWVFYPHINGNCWTDGEGSIDCWRVTLMTPISMTCVDQNNETVDEAVVVFKVDVDGEDYTEEYCLEIEGAEMTQDGWCNANAQLPEFRFTEISEHNLMFACQDQTGQRGTVDDEKFKVEEEGFSLWLNHKWNLISVPVNLLDNSLDIVFEGNEDYILSVWYYDAIAGEWLVYTPNGDDGDDDFDTMEVGKGYWILVNNLSGINITIGGSLLSPAAVPPSVPIKGDSWNLIGYYGSEGLTEFHGPIGAGKTAQCALDSIGDSVFDIGFTSLYTYWEPDNPNSWIPLSKLDNMDPGAGYWVYSTEDANYVPVTTCGLSP